MLKIYRPIKTNFLTQGFGENRNCIKDGVIANKFIDGTCPAGFVPFYQSVGLKAHNGEDWLCYKGEPIYHCGEFEGTAKTEIDRSGGIGVDIISKDPFLDGGNRVKLRYWHLQKVNVFDGQIIKSGDLIGWGDSTGLSSGDHLHWSLKVVDWQGNTLNKDNGFYGAIDFRPYFENVFILDVLNVKEQAKTAIQLAREVLLKVALFLKNYGKK